MRILVMNAGSTSLKVCLFEVFEVTAKLEALDPLWQADMDWHSGNGKVVLKDGKEEVCSKGLNDDSNDDFINTLLERLWKIDGVIEKPEDVKAVGHRVVHGGPLYSEPTIINDEVKANLEKLFDLAPNHEMENLKGITIAQKLFKDAVHIAVFDTAFHNSLPAAASLYAVPYSWYERLGIRRYGFHGISHQYCARRAAEMLKRPLKDLRIITCHLGGGSSICAIAGGVSIMTSMGYTPLEGLVMQTRSGSIDPGLILHLLHNDIYEVDELQEVLTKESGVKGISGLSGDMRELEAAIKDGNDRAKLAFTIFARSLIMQIASYIPLLGGIDALVFAGGIGEHSGLLRTAVCRKLSYLGIDLNNETNMKGTGDRDVSLSTAMAHTLVVHTKEEAAIAAQCFALEQIKAAMGTTV